MEGGGSLADELSSVDEMGKLMLQKEVAELTDRLQREYADGAEKAETIERLTGELASARAQLAAAETAREELQCRLVEVASVDERLVESERRVQTLAQENQQLTDRGLELQRHLLHLVLDLASRQNLVLPSSLAGSRHC